MPYASTPPERTKPAHAEQKRQAAAKYETKAARLRAEAAQLDAEWQEYKRQAAKKAAKS